MSRKTLVVSEVRDGKLRQVSFEALSAAKQVADSGEVVAVLVGKDVKEEALELIYYGADRVLVVEHNLLENYTPIGYAQALHHVIKDENPDAIIQGHTAIGKDVSAKLAARLQCGLISDATDILIENGEVLVTRPIYSGKAFETKKIREGIQFITIRPNNFEPYKRDEGLVGDVKEVNVAIQDIKTIVKEVVRKASGMDLTEAKVIVSGGRGVRSAEGFKPLQELADVLGGAVGASRGACDADFCDYSLQIGQTGKVVTPEIYIACGISGAIQHLAGMSNSKIIIAINKDPEAPIFNIADFGIVGDLFEVVPMLTEEFRKVLAEAN